MPYDPRTKCPVCGKTVVYLHCADAGGPCSECLERSDYERGRAEGVKEERGRIVAALQALRSASPDPLWCAAISTAISIAEGKHE